MQIATKNQDNREHDIFDSDDYLQYHGGMIATIRALTGQNPRRYFGDSSDPAHPRTRDLREEARRVFRSRVVNPKWIASMRRHGYKGALELAATVDYLFGYDATAQVLDDWMYHQVADAYLRDEELQQFFADSNPWAWQAIAEHDIDAVLARTGLRPDDRILEVGCGWGRHSLARRGFGAVVSIDIAPELLALAERLARNAGLLCDLRQRSFSDIDEGDFQAILSLYDRSVCGFPTEDEDARSLAHLAGLLRPGGWLVFGIDDWPFYLPQASQRWHDTPDGLELVEVQPDRAAMTCTDRVTLVRPNGGRETYALTRRHYYLPELRRLLAGAAQRTTGGFSIVRRGETVSFHH